MNLATLRPLAFALVLPGIVQSTPGLHIDAGRLQQLLVDLSEFGKNPEGGVSRLAFSQADRDARAWLVDLMRSGGLEVWVDAAGNIHGRRGGSDPSLPIILFGSHIDSVPKGGNFDGNVGSMAALEVMLTLHAERAQTEHPLEMVVWAAEDSGKGLFGSRSATRGPDPGELELTNEEGLSVAERMRRLGLEPDIIDTARIRPEEYAAYLELHIEQGPVLFRRGVEIGVVEGIVGVQHFEVSVEGFANHAGTTPMEERRDALIAASRLIRAVREEVMAKPGSQVGNVGWVRVAPGAPNVVPGLVTMPIELRALDEDVLADMIARIRARAAAIAEEDKVSISIQRYSYTEPAPADTKLKELIESVAQEADFSTLRLPSGAGHDAQVLAKHGIPIGMIFVPSRDGISHSPKEWTDWVDCARGAEVLYRTIRALDNR
jgi:N-carbamoyl-L-amino-acid hydrolase